MVHGVFVQFFVLKGWNPDFIPPIFHFPWRVVRDMHPFFLRVLCSNICQFLLESFIFLAEITVAVGKSSKSAEK